MDLLFSRGEFATGDDGNMPPERHLETAWALRRRELFV